MLTSNFLKKPTLFIEGSDLKPNCLLTRYPLVFLFSYHPIFQPQRRLRKALFELARHGYDVYQIKYPKSFMPTNLNDLIKNKLPLKSAHILIDTSASDVFITQQRQGFSVHSYAHLLEQSSDTKTLFSSLLELSIVIAESDLAQVSEL